MVARAFRDALVLGGVPSELVFFSSERGSGIAPGQDVDEGILTKLKETRIHIIGLPADVAASRTAPSGSLDR